MAEDGPRYAIYFVPSALSDLYRFGSAVIGYDCYSGGTVVFPDALHGAAFDWSEITAEPRRYGFHATLKAPFRLKPPATEDELATAMQTFAASRRDVPAITPMIQPIGHFIAIAPLEADPALDALAASCTMAFDVFRAAMTERERERRIASRLTPAQIENLDRWGYPYVLSDFRFHMTLTGKVEPARQQALLALLRHHFHDMGIDRPIAIDRLTLMRQEAPLAPFRVVTDFPLAGYG